MLPEVDRKSFACPRIGSIGGVGNLLKNSSKLSDFFK
jgi:hypothetical protein